jgi:opacity protein-like surface antigen
MDRFDDIWKNRFNEGDAPIGDWNTPDDDLVWEGIAPHIPQKDKRRRYIWLWWAIGLLMLTLLGWVAAKQIFASEGADVKNVKNQPIIEATDLNERTNLMGITLNKDKAESNDNNFTNIKNQATASLEIAAKANVASNEKSKKTISTAQKYTRIERNRQLSNISSTAANEKITDKIIEIKKQRNINDLSKVPFLDLNNLAQKNMLNSTINCLPSDEDDHEKSKTALSVNAGAVYWQHKISDQYASDLSPFDFNYGDDWGWQTSLLATIDINDYLTPYVGIQYESVSVTSGHNSELNYSTASEQGTNTNEYTQNLATPYGLSEATFRLDRDENFGEEMTDLTVDFKSKHQIQNWSMPFGLRVYPMGKKQRIQWNASVGMGINYLSSIQNSLDNVDTHHDFIQYSVDSPAIFNSPTIEQWHYDVRLGTGLDYFINNNLKVNFQYNWSKGLNPVFQQGDYATKINRHQLSIGGIQTLNFK